MLSTSALTPMIICAQLPIMLILGRFKPNLLKKLNSKLVQLDRKLYTAAFRIHLFVVSILQSPSACIHLTSQLLQSKSRRLKFIIFSPFLLPLTALKNKPIDYEKEYYEQTFEIEWSIFMIIYSGAV